MYVVVYEGTFESTFVLSYFRTFVSTTTCTRIFGNMYEYPRVIYFRRAYEGTLYVSAFIDRVHSCTVRVALV